MLKSKAKLESVNISSALVVDGKLILTLLEAVSPIVWQMDLDQVKSAALEVIEDKKKKAFSLILRNAKGETIEIAPFEEKDKAVHALMITSKALQEGQGKIRPQSVMTLPNQVMQQGSIYQELNVQKKSSNKIGAFLAIGMIIILILIWSFSIPSQEGLFKVGEQGATGSGSPAGANETGVPVSADDFLSSQ